MKKLITLSVIVFVFAFFVSSGIAFARCGMCQSGSGEEGEPINAVCPVMGGEVIKEYSYAYEGKTYYFCCHSCIDSFKNNPEDYI